MGTIMKKLGIIGPVLSVLLLAAPVQAAETGALAKGEIANLGKITPNGPYRLWSAINKVLPDYAALVGGAALRAQVEGMTAADASGKNPGHVMAQTVAFRDLLEAIRGELKLAQVEVFKDPLGRAVTPAVVFVNAGFNMDAVVEAYHVALNKPDAKHGKFYDVPVASGKSPSDVFALVELASRRLRLIQGS
jgi:hypothetical protein